MCRQRYEFLRFDRRVKFGRLLTRPTNGVAVHYWGAQRRTWQRKFFQRRFAGQASQPCSASLIPISVRSSS